ncbi:MAG: DUF3108 domain-containing protein [Pseudomonadota bacterium]
MKLNWSVIIFSALVFVSVTIFSFTVAAQEASSNVQKMEYNVYAGGIHALEANLTNDLSDAKKYNIVGTAKTHGILGKLAPWEGSFSTKGWKESSYKPQEHESITTFRDETESKTYSYNKNGSFKDYVRIKKGKDKKASPSKDLTENTIDILSATLNTMQMVASDKNTCKGEREIFDGKRRFKLRFDEVRKTELSKSGYNAYTGPAIECTILVIPVAGKWHEKPRGWASIQEQGRKKGSLPTMWFAVVEEGKPAIPVKARVKTDYGTLFMHLTSYQTDTKKLKL